MNVQKVIKHWDFILPGLLIGLAILSCSKSGDAPKGQQVFKPPSMDLPFEQEPSVNSPIKLANYRSSYQRVERCLTKPSTLPPIMSVYAIDGLPDEWSDVPRQTGQGDMGDVVSYQVARVENGMTFFFSGDVDSWFIKLTGYSEQAEKIKSIQKYLISLSQSGTLKINDQELIDPSIAVLSRSELGIELFLSDYILDGVHYYPLWSLNIEGHQGDKVYVRPPLIYQSTFTDHRPISTQYCDSESFPYSISWYLDSDLPKEIMEDIEDILIRASNILKLKQVNISLLVGRVSELSADLTSDQQIILVDPAQIQGGVNQVFARAKLYNDIIRQYFKIAFIQMGEMLSKTDTIEVISSSFSTAYFIDVFGLYTFLSSLVWYNEADKSMESFGVLMGFDRPFDEHLSALSRCKETQVSVDCYFNTLVVAEPKDGVLNLWRDGDKSLGYSSEDLLDRDFDGLPLIVEKSASTSDLSADTDLDGWTDYSELLLDFDPKNPINHPEGMSFDGAFGEWINLAPSRVFVDKKREQLDCPLVDIAYYSAIKTDRVFQVGAKLSEIFKNLEQNLEWKVAIDFADNESKLISLRSHDRFFIIDKVEKIYLPFGVGLSEFEAWISIPENLPVEDISVKISIFNEGLFCDDTPWFNPSLGS